MKFYFRNYRKTPIMQYAFILCFKFHRDLATPLSSCHSNLHEFPIHEKKKEIRMRIDTFPCVCFPSRFIGIYKHFAEYIKAFLDESTKIMPNRFAPPFVRALVCDCPSSNPSTRPSTTLSVQLSVFTPVRLADFLYFEINAKLLCF